MKKYVLLLITIFFITGCNLVEPISKDNNPSKENKDDIVYEYHYYDEDFEHTEDFIVKFDKNGNFKSLETITIYDKRTESKYCPENIYNKEDYIDLTYPGVTASCTVSESGQKLVNYMNAESVKAGYLQDDKDYRLSLQYIYEEVSSLEKTKETFNSLLDRMKKENIVQNERNYIVIDNKKVSW